MYFLATYIFITVELNTVEFSTADFKCRPLAELSKDLIDKKKRKKNKKKIRLKDNKDKIRQYII